MFVVTIGWVIFYHIDLNYGFDFIKNMLFLIPSEEIKETYAIGYYLETKEILVIFTAILCSVPLFKNMIYLQNKWAKIGVNVWLLFIYALSVLEIAVGTYNPFIYFRF